jgi:hypothetical protein
VPLHKAKSCTKIQVRYHEINRHTAYPGESFVWRDNLNRLGINFQRRFSEWASAGDEGVAIVAVSAGLW